MEVEGMTVENVQVIDQIEIVEDGIYELDGDILVAINSIAHDHMYLMPHMGQHEVEHSQETHACTFCGKTLATSYSLKKHIEDCHEDNRAFECTICLKGFSTASKLEKHKLIHSDEKNVNCPICSKTFLRLEALKLHMRVHSNVKPYKCMFCDKEFKFHTPWKMHEATHSDDQPYECNLCGVKFSMGTALKDHQEEGICVEETFSCIDCQTEYVRRMDYLRHLSDMHGGKLVQKNFACSFCDKSFIYQSLLRVHERRHTGEEPYQCHLCSKMFLVSAQLRNHICMFNNEEEGDTEVYIQCGECSYQTTSKRAMNIHVRTHSSNYFTCQFCPKKFIREEKWEKHLSICQDSSARNVPCPHCPMTFISTTAQKIHESRIHKDYDSVPVVCDHHYNQGKRKKSWKSCNLCQVCGKCFTEKSVLIKHYRVHTGERPYQCQFCGNRLTSPSALANHERIHTGERPHKCTLCGKRFAQRTSLVEHHRRHTKDMPHKCLICGKGFMVPSLLKKHQNTHYKGKTNAFNTQ